MRGQNEKSRAGGRGKGECIPHVRGEPKGSLRSRPGGLIGVEKPRSLAHGLGWLEPARGIHCGGCNKFWTGLSSRGELDGGGGARYLWDGLPGEPRQRPWPWELVHMGV